MTDSATPRDGVKQSRDMTRCPHCNGDGELIACIDDLCHAQGTCMHRGYNLECGLCHGAGVVSKQECEAYYDRGREVAG